jgi:hypothetical protein
MRLVVFGKGIAHGKVPLCNGPKAQSQKIRQIVRGVTITFSQRSFWAARDPASLAAKP